MRVSVADVLAAAVLVLELASMLGAPLSYSLVDIETTRLKYNIVARQVDDKLYVNASVYPGNLTSMKIYYKGGVSVVENSTCVITVEERVPEILVSLIVSVSGALYMISTKTSVSLTETPPNISIEHVDNTIIVRVRHVSGYRLSVTVVRESGAVRTVVLRETRVIRGGGVETVNVNAGSGRYTVTVVVETDMGGKYVETREVAINES